MKDVRKWIEAMIRFSQDQAEYGEFRRKVQDRLFIFAIEIGRGKKLTPTERTYFEKTQATAEVLIAITEKSASNLADRIPYDEIMEDCVVDWIRYEPALRETLESLLGYSFAEHDTPAEMCPRLREMIAHQIRAIARFYPDQLSEGEIAVILDRLDHPLDRA